MEQKYSNFENGILSKAIYLYFILLCVETQKESCGNKKEGSMFSGKKMHRIWQYNFMDRSMGLWIAQICAIRHSKLQWEKPL